MPRLLWELHRLIYYGEATLVVFHTAILNQNHWWLDWDECGWGIHLVYPALSQQLLSRYSHQAMTYNFRGMPFGANPFMIELKTVSAFHHGGPGSYSSLSGSQFVARTQTCLN